MNESILSPQGNDSCPRVRQFGRGEEDVRPFSRQGRPEGGRGGSAEDRTPGQGGCEFFRRHDPLLPGPDKIRSAAAEEGREEFPPSGVDDRAHRRCDRSGVGCQDFEGRQAVEGKVEGKCQALGRGDADAQPGEGAGSEGYRYGGEGTRHQPGGAEKCLDGRQEPLGVAAGIADLKFPENLPPRGDGDASL